MIIDLTAVLLYNIFSIGGVIMDEQKNTQKKSNLVIPVGITLAIIIFLVFIVNKTSISEWISSRIAIFSPIIIGGIIAYICNPFYKFYSDKVYKKLSRKKLKKALSLISTYLSFLLIIVLIFSIVIPQVIESCNDFISKVDGYAKSAIAWINDSPLFNATYDNLGEFFDKTDAINRMSTFISGSGDLIEDIFNYALSYGKGIISGARDFFVGLFISIYLLIFKDHVSKNLKRIMRAFVSRERYDYILNKIARGNKKFGDFLVAQLFDAFIVGIISFITFSIFGIPYAPLVSVIVAVTNVIPIFGPFIGGIPSAFIIFISDPSKALLFIVLIIIIQQIDGNIIAPIILGSSTGLTSLGVILAITIMGGYWGIFGMFLGVPLFAMIFEFIHEIVNERLEVAGDPDFPPEYIDEEEDSKKHALIQKLQKSKLIRLAANKLNQLKKSNQTKK